MKRNTSIVLLLLILLASSSPVWADRPQRTLAQSSEEVSNHGGKETSEATKSTEWDVELINKGDLSDYPSSVIGGSEYRIRVEVRVSIPAGSTGTLRILGGSAWLFPEPPRYTFVMLPNPPLPLTIDYPAGTHVFEREISFQTSIVYRDSWSWFQLSADLSGDGGWSGDWDSYDYTLTVLPAESALDVKFRGTIEELLWGCLEPAGASILITEVLEDPTGHLSAGWVVAVWPDSMPQDLGVGDHVEVFGDYHPNVNPRIHVWRNYHYIEESEDITPPSITNIRQSSDAINKQGCPEPTTVTIRADVTDPSDLAWVRLYYRPPGGSWTYRTMSHESGNTYKATIGPFADAGTVTYFIAAQDNAGNERETQYYTVTINDCDTTPPSITNIRESADPINKQGCPSPTTVTIRADVSDASGLAWVRLYYQPPGGSWTYTTMSYESGNTYKATMGSFSQAGTLYYYVKARDNAGNEAQSSMDTVMINDCPRLPIVLVHGWGGKASDWDTFKGFLEADGIPYRVAATLDPTGSISHNARKIREEIDAAKAEFGVDKVNLVAHSKGGVDSRKAIRYVGDVENLIQLASPNHGTKLADWLWWWPFIDLDIRDVTTWGMKRYFNYQWDLSTEPPTLLGTRYVKNPKVSYKIIIGTAGGIRGELVRLEDPHDSAVSKLGATFPWSASVSDTYPLPGEEYVNATFNLNHSGIREDKAVYEWVMEQLYPGMYPFAAATLEGVGVQESEAAPLLTPFKYAQRVINLAAEITTGETLTHIVTVDAASQASFVIVTLDADLGLVLYDPDGVRIDPTVAAGDPDIGYFQEDAEEWGIFTLYTIQNPTPGDWQMEVAAAVGGTYAATAEVDNDTSLSVSTDKGSYQANEEIQTTATFADGGTPITGASATATIQKSDQTTDTLSLYDDGTHGDITPNDGAYFNTYAGTSVTGYTDIFMTAIASGVRREASTHIVVAPTTAQLTGSYGETPADSDGDGLYNTLRINVGVNVSLAGDYEVSGVLQDASGNTIDQAGFPTMLEGSGELGVGQQFVSLDFDGGPIYQHGVDGPYSLRHVVVYDQNDASIQTDYVQDAYTTSAYAYTNFQRDAIVLTSNNSDVGVDIDGDGFFDYLNVNLEFDVLIPGSYNVNARLVDRDGGEIVWASTDAYLSGGAQVVQLQFDGTKIGEHGVNGPYIVRDLTIFITTGGTSAIFDEVYTTQYYSFTDFRKQIVYLPLILKNYS